MTGLWLQDELITLAVSVWEDDHHHAVDDLLALSCADLKWCGATQNFISKDVVNEILHHQIHVSLGCCSESTRFDMLLPLLEVGALKHLLPVSIELVKLVFEELSHNSEAWSIEEEIKLLVVLLSLWVCNFYFRLLFVALLSLYFTIRRFFQLVVGEFSFILTLLLFLGSCFRQWFVRSLNFWFNFSATYLHFVSCLLILHQNVFLKIDFRFHCFLGRHKFFIAQSFWSVIRIAQLLV